MRIIAGSLKGRQFNSPHGHHIHPMGDKIRGALFNTLGDISGLSVLDAFAGSGALGFEAASRGASRVVAVDSARPAQSSIADSIRSLELSGPIKLIRASVTAWLSTTDEHFDIVLLDPPYDDLQPDILAKLASRAKPGGLVVLSQPPNANLRLGHDYLELNTKNYGDAELVFYRRAR